MPFLGLWRQIGTEILPTSPVDTLRIPGAGEYSTIERTATDLTLTSSASGNANLILDAGNVGSMRVLADGSARFQVNNTGIGFYGTAAVAQQSKAASPAPDSAALVTAFDELQTILANYGLLS